MASKLFFRRIQAALFSLVTIVTCLVFPAAADEWPTLYSEAAILMDADTGQILYAKEPDKKMYPASITKIMTGMLALQYLQEDTVLTMTQEDYDTVSRTSAHIALQPGEQMSVRDALSALTVSSANDAANLLASGVSGTLSEFAALMTQTAHDLGAVNTHFTNANGLPDSEHYTTARDMALITAAALKTEGFVNYFSLTSCQIAPTNMNADGHNLTNKNRYISGTYAMEGLLMSKTGWTNSALGTLVTAVRRGNTTLIAVVLKSSLLENKYQDTTALMNYGFSHYSKISLFPERLNAMLKLEGYTVDADQSVSVLLPVGTSMMDLTSEITGEPEYSDNGKAWLHARLMLQGEPLADVSTFTVSFTRDPEEQKPTEQKTFAAVIEAETHATEAAQDPQLQENSSLKMGAIILSGIAVFLWLLVLVSRMHEKRQRRRATAEKIRRMKQRSGYNMPHTSKRRKEE